MPLGPKEQALFSPINWNKMESDQMPYEAKIMSTSISRLGLEIFQESSPLKNLVLSPTSILIAMVMLHEGSVGDTRDEIASLFVGALESSLAQQLSELLDELTQRRIFDDDRALGMFDEGEPELRISPVNSIWIQEGYKCKRAFMDVVRSDLSGVVHTIDMIGSPHVAANEVNEWVDQATNGCIDAMISEYDLSLLSRLLVCNALYFKATWMRPFDTPIPGKFHLLNGSSVRAQMMKGGGFGKRYAIETHYWAVELSYVNDDVTMMILVPSEPGVDALLALEDRLSAVLEELSFKPLGLGDYLTIPQFSVSSRLDISDNLREIGIERLFSREAELSGVSDAKPLWIDAILHGASIEVDRYGTEAAAVTMATFLAWIPPEPIIDLVVDRPFIFVIFDKPTETILFLGRVTDPTSGEGNLEEQGS
jgi:serpin B